MPKMIREERYLEGRLSAPILRLHHSSNDIQLANRVASDWRHHRAVKDSLFQCEGFLLSPGDGVFHVLPMKAASLTLIHAFQKFDADAGQYGS